MRPTRPASHQTLAPAARAARLAAVLVLGTVLAGCEPPPETTGADSGFRLVANARSPRLDEVSGLQASARHPDVLWVHNDDGAPRVHAVGIDGADRGYFDIEDAVNVDWEDMTRIPGPERDLLVLADIGDNEARRSNVWLYLVPEPDPGRDDRFAGEVEALNWISLRYPDGPRDAESIAWDPLRNRLLILSKRDRPPRLYALDGEVAVTEREAELVYLGEVDTLRPPSAGDRQGFGNRIGFISQPTGLDISPAGDRAALITYRSLYLFDRPGSSDWLDGLQAQPLEILGPAPVNEEAVGFRIDGTGVWVSTEGERPPLFQWPIDADGEEQVETR